MTNIFEYIKKRRLTRDIADKLGISTSYFASRKRATLDGCMYKQYHPFTPREMERIAAGVFNILAMEAVWISELKTVIPDDEGDNTVIIYRADDLQWVNEGRENVNS